MKINISKKWLLNRVKLEEGLEIGAGIPPFTSRRIDLDWSRFPIREMYRRNWFADFKGTLTGAVAASEHLLRELMESATRRPVVVSMQRQLVRTGSHADPYALLAWQWRVLALANMSSPNVALDRRALDDSWLNRLVQLSQFADGPLRAREFLRRSGINLIIEPHLSSTHLDGAALLGDHGPVVALTLRYDRLDNFWFVLLHEIIHVKEHLERGKIEDIFDDFETAAPVSQKDIELEADTLAGEALIPERLWKTALPRFVRTEASVNTFASKLKIHPAIVAGRIRNEAENFVILSNLVGQGEVRKLFPEVVFAL